MDTILYFCDIRRPLTLSPRSPLVVPFGGPLWWSPLVVPFGGPHLWFRPNALMGVENEDKSVNRV
jgi:hypothetical protein